MPVYSWKGLNTAGKSVTGTRDADGPKALRQALRKDGVFITEHREVLAGGQQAAARPGASNVSLLNRQIDLEGDARTGAARRRWRPSPVSSRR